MTIKKRTKVLFLDHQAELGGGEFFLLDILGNLDKNEYEPVVYLGNTGPLVQELAAIGIPARQLFVAGEFRTLKRDPGRRNGVMALLMAAGSLGRMRRQLTGIIKEEKIDILFANTIKSAIIGLPAARKCGIRSVWLVHDILSPQFYRRLFLTALKYLTGKPDAMLGVSRSVVDSYQRLFGQKGTVVHNGVDLARFDPRVNGEEVRQQLGLKGKAVVSLIGRLEPWKGQTVLIKAAAKVLKKNAKTVFLLVGGPLFGREEYERKCRQLAERLGIGGQVRFLGFRRDIPELIAASDIIVHPSTRPEPFGRDVLEAMAGARPVIASDRGGPAEMIEHNRSGLLVKPGDKDGLAAKISDLLARPEARRALGEEARRRAAGGFELKGQVRKIERILSSLAGNDRG